MTGFCTGEDPETGECLVEVMFAPGAVRVERVAPSDLRALPLLPNTRAWARHEDTWLPGRLGRADPDGSLEWIGSKRAMYVRPADLRVRPEGVEFDPRVILKNWAQEGLYLYDARDAMMREVLVQESYAHGMTGVLSAGVDLYQHQLQNVFRVLMDPVQRYVLGDEVGLGKTIQAGMLIRQWMLDEQEAVGAGEVQRKVLVAAPELIVAQWDEELRTRFRLGDFAESGTCLKVISHERLAALLRELRGEDWPWSDLVVDEVQHVVAWADGPAPLRAAFTELRGRAAAAQGLLLLSATPPYGDHVACHALLQLLDPAVYGASSREEFRLRLALRQKVGAALPFLKPGTPAALVRLKLRGLDEAVGTSLPILRPVLDRAQRAAASGAGTSDLAPALEELRTYLREVLRLHNRFIRSRRDQLQDLLTFRGSEDALEPGHDALPELAELGLADDVMEQAAEELEAWRAARLAQVEGDEDGERQGARVHEALWVALCAGEPALKALLEVWGGEQEADPALEALLGSEAIAALRVDRPGKREEAARRGLARLAQGDAIVRSKLQALASWLERHLASEGKVVIFGSGPGMADAVHAQLASMQLRGVATPELRVEVPRGERDSVRRSFRDASGRVVLTCDSTGEEGLNLQAAGVIVHMDLPLSANRLEQRIGRLDRIGRTKAMRQRVVLAAGDEALDAQRMALLDRAYAVFHQSVSGLQAAVDEQAGILRLKAFREGLRGLRDVALQAREGIEAERARVAVEQDAEVASDEEVGASLSVKAIVQDETRGDDVQAALDGWVVGCYNLARAGRDQLGDGAYVQPRQRGVGLLDTGQQEQVLRFLDEGATFRRQKAAAWPQAFRLRRLGDGLFDAFARMARYEDRGRCFAVWRQVRGWDPDMEWAGFRFDVLVRVPDSVADLLAADGGGGGSAQGVLRRLRSYLPTFRKSVWVRRDGVVEARAPLLAAFAQRPTNVAPSPVTDTQLHKGRWKLALPDHINLEAWPATVDCCADAALAAVQADPEVVAACTKAAEAYLHDSRRREAVLDLRARLVGDGGEGGEGLLAQDLRRERATREGFVAALRAPEVRLDSGGFLLASGKACPAKAQAKPGTAGGED